MRNNQGNGRNGMFPDGHHRHPEGGITITLKRISGVTKKDVLRQPYYFQMPPTDEFGWDSAGNWTDYTTLDGGTFTGEGSRGLRTITLRTLVLDYNPPFASRKGGNKHHAPGEVPHQNVIKNLNPIPGFGDSSTRPGYRSRKRRPLAQERTEIGFKAPNPQKVAAELQRIESRLTPVLLVVWNKALYAKPDIRMPVTLRSLSVRERAGEPDARYFDFQFVEYRRPKMRRRGYAGHPRKKDLPAVVQVDKYGVATEAVYNNGGIGPGETVGTRQNPATLRMLAKYWYGQPSEWKRIAAKNGLKNWGGSETLDKLGRGGRAYRNLTIPRIVRRRQDDDGKDKD
jgi:hypothetical protein